MSESDRGLGNRDLQNDILNNYIAITSQIHVEGRNDEMKSSPIRRTFCLIILFDLVLCLILWILRISTNDKVTFKTEVVEYKFTISLFDTVMLACVRFIFLEVMYGGLKSKRTWWIALSTAGTNVFVIVKMLFSYFKQDKPGDLDLMYYIPIILTFIMTWVETIFLVCRMLPKERAAEEVSAFHRSISGDFATSTQSLVSTNPIGSESGTRVSRSPSIDNDEFYSSVPTRAGSPTMIRRHEMHNLAHSLQNKAMDLVMNRSDWTYLAGDAVQGCVSSKELISYRGKIFRIEALLEVAAQDLFRDMVENCEQSPQWNPHSRIVKKIESITGNIDIIYNVTNEALRGYIKPRDFVLLRTWKSTSKGFLISMTSIDHDDCPPQADIVRGEYGLGAVYIEGMDGDLGQCKYVMIMNNDIKGKVFRPMVDRAIPGILLDIVTGLRQHCLSLCATD